MSLSDARAADEALNRLPPRPLAQKPGPDARDLRRRMREVITQHLTMSSNVTVRDLERAGFSRVEIADHFTAAARAARAGQIVG